jgi:hypothetical protein
MNRIYSKVWNAALGAVVVASELARSKSTVDKRQQRSRSFRLVGMSLAIMLALTLAPKSAYADVCNGSFAPNNMPTAAADAFACGALAQATGQYSTALGNQAMSMGNYSVALGYTAIALGTDSMALGHDALSSGASSVAIGRDSLARAQNSIALGAGSVADQDNTLSIGAAGAERRITHVDVGINDTDAVNVSQLNAVSNNVAQAQHYFKASGKQDGSDDAIVNGDLTLAAGANARATANAATALGNQAMATGIGGTAVGQYSMAFGDASVAVGQGAQSWGFGNTALGASAVADADQAATALGALSEASGTLSAPGGGIYQNDASSGTQANPDGFVWSAVNDGDTVPTTPDYAGYAGTSQATPHVTGTVAMILSAARAADLPTPTPAQIKTILTSSARAFPVVEDHPIGAGIVDAYAAVNLAINGDDSGTDPGDDNEQATGLTKGAIVSGQTANAGTSTLYSITVPAGATTLNIRTLGGSGDVSLYVKAGSSVATDGSNADFSSSKPGTSQAVVIPQAQGTTYYIRVATHQGYDNLSILADYAR